MNKPKFTPDQQNAIDARGGSLLLSAGAGSGKTAVLTERVLGLLTDPHNPGDIDRLLIVTYTRAAAAEMRERISAVLEAHISEDSDRTHLRAQLFKLPTAKISTVHALCKDIICEYGEKAGISPDFRIADEKESAVWEEQAVLAAIESRYEAADPEFYELVELISRGRDDRRFIETIKTLYTFVRSHPFYRERTQKLLRMYAPGSDGEAWWKIVTEYCESLATYARSRILSAKELVLEDEKLLAAYGDCILGYADFFEDVALKLQSADRDAVYRAIRAFTPAPFGRLTKYEDTEKKARVTALRDVAADAYKELFDSWCSDREGLAQDLAYLYPKMKLLFDITFDYEKELDAIKSRYGVLDFSDLEHSAIALLCDRGLDGTPQPSAAASALSQGFEEIFVDEYQDTNEVQELIFTMISRGGENLFTVGDVKQSIYSFRRASPEIFLAKKQAYSEYDGSTFPAKISLDMNFRSAPGLIDAVNFFFEHLMTRALGDIDYAGGEQLVPGRTGPNPTLPVSVHVVSAADEELSAAESEARHVAERIEKLIQEGIPSPEGTIPVKAGDICILMRSPSSKAEVYERALREKNIGCSAEKSGAFLDLPEVSAVVSLLRAVQNPLLDIELAAAAVSPLFAFSADLLADLRITAPGRSLYEGVRAMAERGEQKCAELVRLMSRLRILSATGEPGEVINAALDFTGYERYISTGRGGERAVANIRLLTRYADEHSARERTGLMGFLGFLDRIKAMDKDLPSASLSGSEENVSVMSIHRSKGLEFPVVFLCDCAKKFNEEDLRGSVLMHGDLGFACMRRDTENFVRYPTIPLSALKIDLRRKMRSEEMRVLYVALTRAKTKLFITGALADPDKKIAALAAGVQDGRPSAYLTERSHSYLDWIVAACLCHPAGEALGQTSRDFERTAFPELEIEIVPARAPEQSEGEHTASSEPPKPDDRIVEMIRRRAEFVYPNAAATRIPTKLAVTDLLEKPDASYRFAARPAFYADTGLSPAEVGNAHHLFMQFCDYKAAAHDAGAELERLRKDAFLTGAQADVIDIKRIAAFFESETAARMFASDRVLREYRFLAEVGEGELGEYLPFALGDNRITVQGIADCLFFEDDGIVLLDYKTNRTSSGETLLEKYRPQLEVYSRILSDMFGTPVKEALIYSFWLGRTLSAEKGRETQPVGGE